MDVTLYSGGLIDWCGHKLKILWVLKVSLCQRLSNLPHVPFGCPIHDSDHDLSHVTHLSSRRRGTPGPELTDIVTAGVPSSMPGPGPLPRQY
jgi:hypothetical protein